MDPLYSTAQAKGILTEFHDAQGHLQIARPEALRAALAALPELDHATHERRDDSIAAQAYRGDFDRGWLLTVQLYSVVSRRNWGIGDFTDLAALMELAAPLGCAGIGLNPLHALFDDCPSDCSPYAPNSRLFLNPLYIDIEALPEFAPADLDQAALAAARARTLVDYEAVARLKYAALRRCFAQFRAGASHERRAAFETFRSERGMLLKRFASFEVLRHRFGGAWWDWPPQWRRPDDAAIERHHAGEDEAEIAYVEYLQWSADAQLARCAALAKAKAMAVGLYLDVAVGVLAGGFDAWNAQTAISPALSVGAPPDLLNTAGQDWGLAGFNGPSLEAAQFAPFRQMLQASMRYAGAIRLDHILGLNRLYLIPKGFSPREGVYVRMPLQALLRVIAQESEAARCIVVGEDLGTVPDGFREALARAGILSYKVMLFERRHDGSFIPPRDYDANALVTFNTHDLASFAGWRSGRDLATKHALGIDPGENEAQRLEARHALDAALRDAGLSADFLGVVEYLAQAPSKLLAVALEDIVGTHEQPNVPGTVDTHPNWRRRFACPLEELPSKVNSAALRQALRARMITASP